MEIILLCACIEAHKLLIYHLFEFLIGQCVLLFEVVLLDGEGGLEFLHLVNRLTDLLKTNVEMKLLLLKITTLLIVELDLKEEDEKHAIEYRKYKAH